MNRLRSWLSAWAGRSQRRAEANSATNIGRAARDVLGKNGIYYFTGWDELAQHGDAYVQSFDRRLPPSIFVSERDRLRANMPMPLAERCIGDRNRD